MIPDEVDLKVGNVTVIHRRKHGPSTHIYVDGKEVKNVVSMVLKCAIQEPFTVELQTKAVITDGGHPDD
jgi:hypothetical protein